MRWKQVQYCDRTVRAALALAGVEAVELVPPRAWAAPPAREYGEIKVAGQLIGRIRRHPTAWKVRGVGPLLGEAWDQHIRKDLSNALGGFLRDVLYRMGIDDSLDDAVIIRGPRHVSFIGTVSNLAAWYSLQVQEPVRLPGHASRRRSGG